MYLDGKTPEMYGRLVYWDTKDDAFDDMHTGRARNPGEGLIILEIQKGIMDFLLGCVYSVLHDIDRDLLTSSQVEIQPGPPAITAEASEWPTLAAIAAEDPLRTGEYQFRSAASSNCSKTLRRRRPHLGAPRGPRLLS